MATARTSRITAFQRGISGDGPSSNGATFADKNFIWKKPEAPAPTSRDAGCWPVFETNDGGRHSMTTTTADNEKERWEKPNRSPFWDREPPEAATSGVHTTANTSPSQTRESFMVGQERFVSTNFARAIAFQDNDQAGHGFLDTNRYDNGPSRGHAPRQSTSDLSAFRSQAEGLSRTPSLAPARETQGSPAVQDRAPYRSKHTATSSMTLDAGSLARPFSLAPGSSNSTFNLPGVDFNAMQGDLGSSLAGMQNLTPAPRPSSHGGNSAYNSLNQMPYGSAAQGWRFGDRYANELSGSNPSLMTLEAPRRTPSNRGSVAEHRYSPAGTSAVPKLYGSPAEAWNINARPPSRDTKVQAVQETERPYVFPPLPPFYTAPYLPPLPNQLTHPVLADQYIHSSFGGHLAPANYPLSLHPSIVHGAGFDIGQGRDMGPCKALQEFLASKNHKRSQFKGFYGHIVEFCGDQYGSRFIQDKIQTANSDERERIFKEIEPNALPLMQDQFGNYVVQKLIEHGTLVQKKRLAKQMTGKLQPLSTQVFACRVVQHALQHILLEQQLELMEELVEHTIPLSKHRHGNHVVQKAIDTVPLQHVKFIARKFKGSVADLSCDEFACRVVQRLLEHETGKEKAQLVAEIHESAARLIPNDYGNYVAQHIMKHGDDEDRAKMIEAVLSDLIYYSKSKHASNVVENCVKGSREVARAAYAKLRTSGGGSTSGQKSVIATLAEDSYGNYVLQSLLRALVGSPEFDELAEEVHRHLGLLLPEKYRGSEKGSNVPKGFAHLKKLEELLDDLGFNTPSQSEANMASGLQVDVISQAPTPVLTMAPNTPQSSNPPSTDASAIGDGPEDIRQSSEKALDGEQAQVHGSPLRVADD